MANPELTKLRRSRTRAYMRLRRLEELTEAARIRAQAADAAVYAIAPWLRLAPPQRPRPRRFRKSEIVAATLSALREAPGPIGVRDIALQVLASKGIAPEREAVESALYGVRKVCVSLTRRKITRKIGRGKATQHILEHHD